MVQIRHDLSYETHVTTVLVNPLCTYINPCDQIPHLATSSMNIIQLLLVPRFIEKGVSYFDVCPATQMEFIYTSGA